ncbi:Rossmann-like alpha beta alpha sandwich fold isoform B [Micractinium conductrix]|nr:Rossmann-like alpha beta alpha sandwich fold isoform B [Micractinium conductrix]|eukprot:PSC72031.1 Rossmann-like alpha beta alpha sandwich fold isoform B [Micractinium conductrix]
MLLGGGLLPDGGLPEWVVRRLEGCLHLYQQQAQRSLAAVAATAISNGAAALSLTDGNGSGAGLPTASTQLPGGFTQLTTPGAPPIVLLGAGTPHKPPVIDAGGYVLHESTAYADWLLQRGVPAGDLLKEAQSYDTVGNAYFSLLQHAVPAGWRRIAVVTSEFHMPRTAATFDVVYALAGTQLHGDPSWFHLDYRPVSDEGLFPADVLEARAAKEAAAVAAWQRNTAGMAGLADLHRWLYATHLCYSVARQHEFGRHQEDLDPKLAATY